MIVYLQKMLRTYNYSIRWAYIAFGPRPTNAIVADIARSCLSLGRKTSFTQRTMAAR